MKKRIIRIFSLILALFMASQPIYAKSYTKTGVVNNAYLTTYRYGYNYSSTVNYDPNTGKISSASGLGISGKYCDNSSAVGSYGCSVNISPSSPSISSNGYSATYRVSTEVSSILGSGIPMYVGSQTDVITISSPGPSRSIDELIVEVKKGEIYYNPEHAQKYPQTVPAF